jgi:hypothetical protein
VLNVFHTVPHPSKNGSGVLEQLQHQRLACDGRQLQSGHRMSSSRVSRSRAGASTITGAGVWLLLARKGTPMQVLYTPR